MFVSSIPVFSINTRRQIDIPNTRESERSIKSCRYHQVEYQIHAATLPTEVYSESQNDITSLYK